MISAKQMLPHLLCCFKAGIFGSRKALILFLGQIYLWQNSLRFYKNIAKTDCMWYIGNRIVLIMW